MEDWKSIKLGDICSFQEGYVNPSQTHPEYFDGDVKWLRATDLNNSFVYDTTRTLTKIGFESAGKSALLFKPNTIAISKSGTIGRLGILKDYMCGNRAVINIAPSNIVDTRYIFYFLLSIQSRFEHLAVGSVQKNLYVPILSDIPLNLPPLATQKKIAEVLSSLDDKIELNNKINANLEQQAQAIFKSWFVDFEPFGGEMPAGWKVGKLGEIIDIRDGTHDSPKFYDSGFPLVTSKHLESYQINYSDVKYITEEDYNKINERSKVDTGDILYSMIGTVGNITLVSDNPVEYAIKNVGLFKTSQSQIYKYFVLNYLKSEEIKNYIDQHLAGSTQKYISLSELRGIPLNIPGSEILLKYNSIVEPLISKLINNVNENKKLSTLRNTLLPKLMSGELEV